MDKNYNDTSGYNRMFLAVHNGEINLLPSLLKKYSATDRMNGKILINVAAARGHAEIVRMLMKADTDVNTLLIIAIKENQPSVFHLLIKECDVNVKDCDGETALHYAAENNCIEFAKTLIENGANVKIRNIHGATPIFRALQNQNIQLANILFQNGAVLDKDIEVKHLEFAAKSGNLEMIKLLLRNGRNSVDILQIYDQVLLFWAITAGNFNIVEYLIKNGLKSEKTIIEDSLGLFDNSLTFARIDILKFLIDRGLKTKRRIILNVWRCKEIFKMWKYLLTCRSKLDSCAYFSQTQLHWAIRAGEVEIVKLLTKQEANTVDTDSFTCKLAVYIAVESGNEDILHVLLDAGYSTDRCFDDVGPLHLAATYEETRLLELLLKAGADVNSETTDCLTPLHFAVLAVRSNLVKILLENGADFQFEEHTLLSFALDIFSSSRAPVTPLTFTNLVEITKMLVPYEDEEDFYDLLYSAYSINVLSDENKQNSILILNSKTETSNVNEDAPLFGNYGDCKEFRPELVKCIFNHLMSDTNIHTYSRRMLEDYHLSRSPEFLHLLMEYNDSESCFRIITDTSEKDYNCQLLLIDYSSNVGDLFNGLINISFSSNVWKTKMENTLTLKLIIARLLLLLCCVESRLLQFCCEHELLDWHEECIMQKLKMKETQIDENFKVTFLDILTEPVETVANYVRNESFRNAIESSLEKFPAFSEFLKIRIEKGVRRNELREECKNIMYNLIKENHKIEFSSDELDQIFSHLSLKDLRKFSEAFL